MTLRIRPLVASDQDFLWDALHVALWDPPPAPLRPREVLEHPGVQIYAEGWGRESDVGVCGEVEGAPAPVGACWMRLVPERKGLAYVDDATPQLGIAVMPGHRQKGYGERLMRAALAAAKAKGIAQVSLTVHVKNPAVALYERCGFRHAGFPGPDYRLMVARLAD
jgi:ribosomal protein S18 acetylase RimI-like enzyme